MITTFSYFDEASSTSVSLAECPLGFVSKGTICRPMGIHLILFALCTFDLHTHTNKQTITDTWDENENELSSY